jgi:hypothetical protein
MHSDLFPSDLWTLSSNTIAKHEAHILDCVYSYSAATSCFVQASDASIQSKIWFSTPALTQDMINKLESLQLFTRSRFQRGDDEQVCAMSEEESYSWFDLVVLEAPTPKIVNGVSLVWLSHKNVCNDFDKDANAGPAVMGLSATNARLYPPATCWHTGILTTYWMCSTSSPVAGGPPGRARGRGR